MSAFGVTQLRAVGPVEMLDGALLAVRRGGGRAFGRALLSGFPLALCALGIYYLERVEGVRALRPLFAALLTLGFLFRGVMLAEVAREYALLLRPTLPVSVARPAKVSLLCTTGVVGLGLWVWMWPMVALASLSPFAIAGLWPFLAIRGGVAPSWLARSACEPERGLSCFGQAFDDTAGMRGVFTMVELLALLGAFGLFVNLYALCSLGLLLAHSMVGLDTALVSTFLSPENTLVPLFVACLTLTLMEPLRAAISAQAFVDARSRRDGADLHAAVDAAIEASRSRKREPGMRPPTAAALWLLCLLGSALLPAPVRAAPGEPTADAPPLTQRSGDAEVRAQVESILGRHEFREFADEGDRTLSDLLERFYRWLDEWLASNKPAPRSELPSLPEIGPWVLIVLALIGVALIASYVRSQRRGADADAKPAAGSGEQALLDREPEAFLDEASRLAQAGDPRAALRALYVATLVTLDRARLIEFDPAHTNWQYLRGMPRGTTRDDFAAFTRLFDHKWYGHELTTMEDYLRGRELADRVCAEGTP